MTHREQPDECQPGETRAISRSADEGEPSIMELGRAAQKASRERLETIARIRRSQTMQIIAVILGAVIGAIIDGLLFERDFDTIAFRAVLTLFVGMVGALLGYLFIWRTASILLPKSTTEVQAVSNRALVVSLIMADLLPSTWAAAGAGNGTLHGYAIVVSCEGVALFLARRVWPPDGRKRPSASGVA
jgi:hypothetical protein